MANKYGVKLCDSIQGALCYDAESGESGAELAVDGILAIGEHGRYPTNAKVHAGGGARALRVARCSVAVTTARNL
jgi:hypothetical protein